MSSTDNCRASLLCDTSLLLFPPSQELCLFRLRGLRILLVRLDVEQRLDRLFDGLISIVALLLLDRKKGE